MTYNLPPMEIISEERIEMNGRPYIRSVRKIDFGKDGVATVILNDPCITEEQRELRREKIRRVIADLERRGLA